jgi:hypothetical protein
MYNYWLGDAEKTKKLSFRTIDQEIEKPPEYEAGHSASGHRQKLTNKRTQIKS